MDASQLAEQKRAVRALMADDRLVLVARFPFTGAVAMRLELVPVHDCRLKTCSTDYRRIYADIAFYRALTPAERLHVLAHEIWHCILLHNLRRGDRDPKKFNIAADIEIYFLLCRAGLGIRAHLPYLLDWRCEGFNAEMIYDELPLLEKVLNAPREEYETSDMSLTGGGVIEGEELESLRMGLEGPGFDKHEVQLRGGHDMCGEGGVEGAYFDDDYQPGWAMADAEAMRANVLSAARRVLRGRGTLPDYVVSAVRRLLRPSIRWQEVLARFVTSAYGASRRWIPPSRRHVWRGLYLQSSRTEVLRAVVAVDTSGSTVDDLPRFFSELNALLGSFGLYELTVIQCDAAVQSVEKYDASSPCPADRTWTARGGGGTDFVPVFDYVRENLPDTTLLVFFTDGYGPAPEQAPPYPVIWILTAEGERPATWGQTVVFKES